MCTISRELIDRIWEKAFPVEGYDSTQYRQDACGAWIIKEKYGDRNSIYGWEVDHIFPKKKLEDRNVINDEIDDEKNLRALNWRNNESKGDDYPVYHARVVARDGKNIEEDRELSITEEKQIELHKLYGKYFKL